jgi:hypothetical protein
LLHGDRRIGLDCLRSIGLLTVIARP